MHIDKYGQPIYTEADICSAYLFDPQRKIHNCQIDQPIFFDPDLELKNIPDISVFQTLDCTVEEFDAINQNNWYMPDPYKNMDIAKWVLDQCTNDEQRQRVGQELLLYLDRGLFPLLQYLKYLVDTMRKYNIVWGVGRGSSVSSYVLFLIGVHKVDSLYYGLDIDEFLR